MLARKEGVNASNTFVILMQGLKEMKQLIEEPTLNINDAQYGKTPTYLEVGSPEDDSFKVECMSVVPRVRERMSSFHSAYLYAYKIAEQSLVSVDIAYRGKYIMCVRPNREVKFYGK